MTPGNDRQALRLEKARLVSAGRLHWFHWLIVALSLLLTLGAWYVSKSQVEEKASIQFHNDAEQVLELVTERMQKYEDGLWGGVGAIQVNGGEIDHAGWLSFADTLSIDVKYPGINGIGVIYHVTPERLAGFQEEQRRTRPDFRVYPSHGEDEYLPITYIEPVAPNRQAIGLDMAHETNRYAAAADARDTGEARITGPIYLVQDAERTPGFLFYAPFYRGGTYATVAERRARFTGLVYAPFVMQKLMQGVLAKHKRQVGLRIADGGETLYDELVAGEADFDPRAEFRARVELPIYGRTWAFDIWSGQSFRAAAENNQPLTILVAGIGIDATLLAMFLFLSRANRNALDYATRASAELEKTAAHERELEARVQADQRFRQIVMAAPGAMLMAHTDGRVVLANAHATRLFDHPENALLDIRLQELIPTAGADPDQPWWHAYAGGSAACGELQAVTRGGHCMPVEVGINNVDIDGGSMLLVVVVDVTERELAKRDLARRAEELSRSNQELDSFAYIASHDLKAPLRGIKHLAGFITEDAGHLLPESSRADLDLLCGRVGRMEALLDGLLQYSRIGDRDSVPEKVVTADVLDDVMALCIPHDGFRVEIQPGIPDVHAPQAMVHLVFRNLISNAVKHHDRDHGQLGITWRTHDEFVAITVSDDGPGIPPEHTERVFQLFQTLKRRDDVEGSGLGLALVKKAITLHGGQIELLPRTGRGASFRLLWPRRARPARQAA